MAADVASRPALLASDLSCVPRVGTVIEALEAAAGEAGEQTCIGVIDKAGESEPFSFAALRASASRVAAHLVSRGVTPGERVLLVLPAPAEFAAAFFGVQLAGAVPVPCAPPFGRGDQQPYFANLLPIVRCAGARVALADEALIESMAPWAELREPEIVSWAGISASPAPDVALPPPPSPDDAALIQFTSGPVTTPRGAVLSHRAVLANVHALGLALGVGPEDVGLSFLPMFQDMGLVGVLLSSLYWRYPSHLMRIDSFLMKPHLWLAYITRFRATMTAAPNFAYRTCARRVSDKRLADLEVDLSSLRVALTGAETVDPATVEEFRARFAPVGLAPDAILPAYGMAENSLAITAAFEGERWRVEHLDPRALDVEGRALPCPADRPGAVAVTGLGRPVAGQEVAVVDPAGETLPERTIGEIVIRGPSLMSRYHGDPAATAAALRGGRLFSGDLGFVADGCLFLTGRAKRMVIKRGRNYYPGDIAAIAAAAAGVDPAEISVEAAPNGDEGTEDAILRVPGGDERQLRQAINRELIALLGIRAEVRAPDAR